MSGIAFVTTCKGRLHHLKQTLPLIVGERPDEIIVVDYGCPDHSGEWVEAHFPEVKVIRVADDPGFCLARARNIGARASQATWLCFIDADVKVSPGWVAWMRHQFQPGFFYRREAEVAGSLAETAGTVCCSRNAFDRLGGYDEVFRGWGGEDSDFYSRLRRAGYCPAAFPAHFISPLPHGDAERVQFHEIKDRRLQGRVNQYYSHLKKKIAASYKVTLPFFVRESMMRQVEAQLRQDASLGAGYPGVAVELELEALLPGVMPPGKTRFVVMKKRRFFGLGKHKWHFAKHECLSSSSSDKSPGH